MTDPTSQDLDRAAALIRAGKLVAFATETVYGLGADALNEQAVARIFEIKGRPRFDPVIVHLSDAAGVARLAAAWPEQAQQLAQRFWPGPLTIVVAKQPIVPDIVTAGLPTVALRVPAHALARELIRRSGTPIAAPSANRFGGVSPTTAEHVRQELGEAVDLVLDGGPCPTGVESTVISFVGPEPVLLRAGGLPLEDVQAAIGPVASAARGAPLHAPGMLPRHYSPRTPLLLRVEAPEMPAGKRIGLLAFREPVARREEYAAVEVLSPQGDLREAAARLFAAMRRLDALGLDLIVAEPVPEEGLGRAINDRLRRASAR